MKSDESKSTEEPASQSTKPGGQMSEEEIVALIKRRAEKDTLRRLPDGSILRFFQLFGAGYKDGYNVQVIINPGVRDRRLKEHKRERRKILFRSKDRAEAVAYFNEVLQRYIRFAADEPTVAERS